ncbi:MAG TPA: class I SAM-dependent methyltransferase [Dehalococcoidales bacterium]|nr:class I SAM-dependent methyltransferase [Dehalococcoidales bacterium]
MSPDVFGCYLCGSPDMTIIATITRQPSGETDFGIPAARYRRLVMQCQECLVYCNVHGYIPDDFYRGRYNEDTYGRQILEKYRQIRGLPREKSDNKHRAERVAAFLDGLGLPREQVSILDVGSGLGVFPAEMKDMGFKCYCIDPDPAAAEHALKNIGVEGAHTGTLDGFKTDRKFDLISFNKVLEHLKKPVPYLKRARDFLSSRGAVYVELPDGDAALEHGTVVDREEFYIEHFTVFNRDSLAYLAREAGFDCLEVKSVHEPSDKYTIYTFMKPKV